jgi:uncharacterized damage-inducible protein DinB
MTILADLLRHQLDYSDWADTRLVNAAGALTNEELNRDFRTADRGVLGTLVHVFAADRIWLGRLSHKPTQGFTKDSDYSLAVLQNEWPEVRRGWREWAADLDEEGAQALLAYTDLSGNPWTQPVWRLVLHVVNHGTHHRGQVAGFLRAMGRTPPKLDLVYYLRETA